jgi:hypothetical protein
MFVSTPRHGDAAGKESEMADNLIRRLSASGDLSGAFSMFDVLSALVSSFLLSLLIGRVYQVTHRGSSYSQGYVQTLVIMAVTVSMIMMVIGSNIARAFSLVGALSIIRFRNAVKESRDVGFMFLAIAAGMACGTRFYLLSVVFTLFMCGAILFMFRFNLFSRLADERILSIALPEDVPLPPSLEKILARFFSDFELVGTEVHGHGGATEFVYAVSVRKGMNAQALAGELRGLHPDIRISLLEGRRELDL